MNSGIEKGVGGSGSASKTEVRSAKQAWLSSYRVSSTKAKVRSLDFILV